MKTLVETIENLINNSEYDKAVEVVKDAFKIEFKAEFLKNDYHFTGDKDKRDIYKITLKRGDRKYSFNFGQSLVNSEFYYTKGREKIYLSRVYLDKTKHQLGLFIRAKLDWGFLNNGKSDVIHYPIAPSLYDVLSCLQKYEVGSFEDFCGEFGYDNDSISAKKTYKAVSKEYDKMCTLFNNEELEVLSYIQ